MTHDTVPSRQSAKRKGFDMPERQGKVRWIVGFLYVGFVLWSLWGAVVPVETYLFRMVHMAFIYALSFLAFPLSKKEGSKIRWVDVGLAVLGVVTIGYALLDLDQFIRRSTVPEPIDFWLGIVAI